MRAGTGQAWPNLGGASVLLIFAALLFSSQLALAQSVFTQQGPKLVGTGAVGGAFQGTSVALSADGNTAIVGGPFDDGTGAVWVYTRSSGVWTQQGSKLVGTGWSGFPHQGTSVALSADGNTAIVGGPGDLLPGEQGGAGRPGSSHAAAASGPSRAASWSARFPQMPGLASPLRCPPTATPRSWVSLRTP
jgi:hypothetical protein